jgi:hypothetical protein
LVGDSVVMTARHVVDRCRSVRVLVKGKKWVYAARWTNWWDGKTPLDVTTLKLSEPLDDVWVFSLRPSQVPLRAYVAALGYPLGEAVSYTNGRVLGRTHDHLIIRILSAQGYSGGPIVDSNGRIVGLINLGIFGRDPGLLTGAYTGDNIIAYDFSSHWGRWRKTLCHNYPLGGIEDCGTKSAPTTPSTSTPPSAPTTTPPTPAPAWAPPTGFTIWTGAGTYAAGTIAYQYAASSCASSSPYARCWGVNVISAYGCREGLFVHVGIYDSNGALIDGGIGEINLMPPNQVAFLHGDTFQAAAATWQVTSLDCFNY